MKSLELFLITYLLFDILISISFGQFEADSTSISPSHTESPSSSESPLVHPAPPISTSPLSKPAIVLMIFIILFFVSLVACVYLKKHKQHWFTKFSPVPTHPRNVDQHNLPVVEKSARVLEENKNNTNTSFEENFLDDAPMIKNSFSSTQLHPRSSVDDETIPYASNQPSTTSLPPSDTKIQSV